MSLELLSAVDLCSDLVRFKSVTPADEGAQEYLAEKLEAMGFTCHRLQFGNINNLFAIRGNGKPHICFAGHTDVVPAGDTEKWKYDPFSATIEDGILYGRGSSDMKGGIAAFVAAISAFLKKKDNQFDGTISLLITGDEEDKAINGTVKVIEWMKKNNIVPDFCLLGEPSNPKYLGQEIKTGRRGSFSGHLIVEGTQGHVAYQHLADNPIPKMLKLLSALDNAVLDEGNEYFAPSNLEIISIDVGNTASNIIPQKCEAKFNIRFNSLWNFEKLEQKISEILDKENIPYSLSTSHAAESFLTPAGEHSKILAKCVERITGNKPQFTTSGGGSDGRFIHKLCPVAEFGLTNETIHKINENTEISNLETLVDIYLDFLETTIS